MQSYHLDDLIKFHYTLSLIKKPSAKLKTAMGKLEDEIVWQLSTLKRIGAVE